jgi:hypothetical protein
MLVALFTTLPTQPGALRLRVWRALKTLGCGSLRDGVYLLPREQAALFEPLVADIHAHGGQACVLDLAARDDDTGAGLLALFDRSEAYAGWRADAQALATALPTLPETEARRRWRRVAEALQALHRIDYLPGAASAHAQAELDALRQDLDARFVQGEPATRDAQDIPRLDHRQFQGKHWATRARPWVDRLACAWLIRRFIDPKAHFLWLADPAGSTPPPREALGFDYDGARFTHVGARVSVEVLAFSFGLDADPRLQRVARAVHFLDVGGIPVPEAAGLEAVLAGLRAVHADDDQLTQAAASVFDALYAAPGESP